RIGLGGTPCQRNRNGLRGSDIRRDVEVTLGEACAGIFVELPERLPGNRKTAVDRREMRTSQLGPGCLQMTQEVGCDKSSEVKLADEEQTLEVEIEPRVRARRTPLLEKVSLVCMGTENPFTGEGEPRVRGSLETDGSKSKLSSTGSLRGKEMAVHKCTISLEGVVESSYGRMGNWVPCPDSNNIKGPLIISFNVDFPKEQLKRSKR
ncbi:hypothetical protein U0070_021274, partial [Myodes glareolus]